LNNDLTFTAELKRTEVDIYGLKHYFGVPDCDIDTTQTATVNFHVEIDARNWGVKDIDIFVDSVIINIEWKTYTEYITPEEMAALKKAGGVEYLNETIAGTIEINTGEKGSKWEVKCEMEVSSQITPNNIEVDFEKKLITVS